MRPGISGPVFSSVLSSLGSAFAALCCAGAPAILGALSAMGLGFLINDLILVPRLALFLVRIQATSCGRDRCSS
jgi:hypothetical protein